MCQVAGRELAGGHASPRWVWGLGRIVAFGLAHWLALANGALFLFVALAFVDPLLMALGNTLPARVIHGLYSMVCHQLPQRSFFLWGYPMAFCQRDLGIYGAALLVGLGFALVPQRLAPLGWRPYLALMAPMALDGFTQLWGWRESTWELRLVTGALFGAASVWFLYPLAGRLVAETALWRGGSPEPARSETA